VVDTSSQLPSHHGYGWTTVSRYGGAAVNSCISTRRTSCIRCHSDHGNSTPSKHSRLSFLLRLSQTKVSLCTDQRAKLRMAASTLDFGTLAVLIPGQLTANRPELIGRQELAGPSLQMHTVVMQRAVPHQVRLRRRQCSEEASPLNDTSRATSLGHLKREVRKTRRSWLGVSGR